MGIEENNYDPTPYLQSRDLRIDFIDEEEGDAGEEEGGADEAGASDVQEVRVPASDFDYALLEATPAEVTCSNLQSVLLSIEGPFTSTAGAASPK